MEKYDPKGSFSDPVVRCERCLKLLKTEDVVNDGECKHCGRKRVAAIGRFLSEEEMNQIKDWEIDPEFIALFEEKTDE